MDISIDEHLIGYSIGYVGPCAGIAMFNIVMNSIITISRGIEGIAAFMEIKTTRRWFGSAIPNGWPKTQIS
jgi:hypothetical protein